MRYNQENNSPIQVQQQSSILSLYPPPIHPPILSNNNNNNNTSYSQSDLNHYYSSPPTSTNNLFPLDHHRPRLNQSSAASYQHRNSTHMSIRDQYSPSTPSFRRSSDLNSRSPPFIGPTRRHQTLSSSPSPISNFTTPLRMDPSAYAATRSMPEAPPMDQMHTIGRLEYIDGGHPNILAVDINGNIDKGFFLADNDWTCYRRNYFSCICSFSLDPAVSWPAHNIQYVRDGNVYPVMGFAMSISAMVADETTHTIDLVQHTPKRDKGPTSKPEKVRLAPKSHHPSSLAYPGGHHHQHQVLNLGGVAHQQIGLTTHGYETPSGQHYSMNQQQQQNTLHLQSEHTFERIQFKQATANNGKRRAAQQYYTLVVELWADVGANGPDGPYIKIAFRQSAKMIVRGRSPGHYQTDRRGSTSSGPGGSAGSIRQGYGGGDTSAVQDFTTPPATQNLVNNNNNNNTTTTTNNNNNNNNNTNYGGYYGGSQGAVGMTYNDDLRHHPDLPPEPLVTPEDIKGIESPKGYRYYPHAVYMSQQDTSNGSGIEMYSHHHQQDMSAGAANFGTRFNNLYRQVKNEGDVVSLPPIYQTPPLMSSEGCGGPFVSKASSSGFFPMSPPNAMGLTSII